MGRCFYVFAAVLFICAFQARSENEDRLTVRPTGRILLDGALNFPNGPLYDQYGPDGEFVFAGPRLADGAAIPDVRLGAKATYGRWLAKVDVGYAFHSLSFKDVYIQYTFGASDMVRCGYFVAPYGLNAAVSSSMIPTMESAASDDFFQVSNRNLGLLYTRSAGSFYAAATGLVEAGAIRQHANDNGRLSAAGVARVLWRPYRSESRIAHAGVSGWIQSPFHRLEDDGRLGPGFFDFSSDFPTRVNRVGLLDAAVDKAKGVYKFSPELLLAYGRVALEAQYYFMNVRRSSGYETYSAHGMYANLRVLLTGGNYRYDQEDSGIAVPRPRSLEFVAGYNYTDGSHRASAIHGGVSYDWSATMTYYFNSYMLARLRYSYTHVRDSDALSLHDCHASIIQARLQFLF